MRKIDGLLAQFTRGADIANGVLTEVHLLAEFYSIPNGVLTEIHLLAEFYSIPNGVLTESVNVPYYFSTIWHYLKRDDVKNSPSTIDAVEPPSSTLRHS